MPNYEYELQGREIYDKNVGELCLPHFFAVTAAQKNDCSLRFHAKIGEHFHQYRINAVNEKSVNLVCAHKSCKAKAKLHIKPEFIEITRNGKRRKNEGFRPTYKIIHSF